MPVQIKISIVALLLSGISALIAVYFDGLVYEELGFADPITLSLNILWSAVIFWLVFELIKKKSHVIKTVQLVLIICVVSAGWDYLEYGMSNALLSYFLEIIFFLIVLLYLNKSQSKKWLAVE